MKINWLILLSVALIQPFMLHSAETAATNAQPNTIAKKPLTQDQIATIAQEAIASCMTHQTFKYKETFQKKLAALLTFRSQLQAENLRDQSARLIIKQQALDRGYIQADQLDDTTASSSASNKRWSQLFRSKLLTESADEQAEITWTYETASLLIQYWPAFIAYTAQKHRERIESLMDNVASDATTLIQKNTIAQVPLTQDQIAVLAQQAIASCMAPQTCKYKATFQRKLAALLTFRSQLQSESLRDKRAGLIIHQQNLHLGCIQADRNDDIDASPSSASNKWWWLVFKNKLLIASADEQAEILWAHETASLLVQYWQTFAAYKTKKQREYDARKQDKAVAPEDIESTTDAIPAPSPKKSRNAEQSASFVMPDRPYTLLDFANHILQLETDKEE